MFREQLCVIVALVVGAAASFGQNTTTPPYVPGVTFQSTNPNYPLPNPFYFEGRIDWNLLKITVPSNTWEFAQRGIHEQDDLADTVDAIQDYRQSISLNSPDNGTCQIVTTAPASGTLDPPPCMFTVRLRLAGLLRHSSPQEAIGLYQQVTMIDGLRLGVHAAIAETYAEMAAAATDAATTAADYGLAIGEYQAELALSPVTDFTTALTGDSANNAHVHWALAEIYRTLGDATNEASELQLYLQATQWHSDTYPWRIAIAKVRLAAMGIAVDNSTVQTVAKPKENSTVRPGVARSKRPKAKTPDSRNQ